MLTALKEEYDFFIGECMNFLKERPDMIGDMRHELGDDFEWTKDNIELYLRKSDFITGEQEHTAREAGYLQGLRDAIEKTEKKVKELEKLLKTIQIANPTAANIKYIYNAIDKVLYK